MADGGERLFSRPSTPNAVMRTTNLLACFLSTLLVSTAVGAGEMFPFVIAGSTTPPAGSVVDMSWLNEGPAGANGFVRVRNGHFVDGKGKRIRFLASNFTFGSCFPEHDMADKLAARLAS